MLLVVGFETCPRQLWSLQHMEAEQAARLNETAQQPQQQQQNFGPQAGIGDPRKRLAQVLFEPSCLRCSADAGTGRLPQIAKHVRLILLFQASRSCSQYSA